MSNVIQETDLVKWFGIQMYSALRKNSSKPHWRDETMEEMFGKLVDEVDEIADAMDKLDIAHRKYDRIISECADVANFAAFIADIARMHRDRQIL